MAQKISATYRLTEFAKGLLSEEAVRQGDSQVGVLERLIRENLKAPISIYALRDPETEELFYVGHSQGPQERLYHILRGAVNSTVQKRIQEVHERNLEPDMVILEKVPEDSKYGREAWWVDFLWGLGCPLLNKILIPLGDRVWVKALIPRELRRMVHFMAIIHGCKVSAVVQAALENYIDQSAEGIKEVALTLQKL